MAVSLFQDIEMYYEPTDTPAMARTSNLNEELGQVSNMLLLYIYIVTVVNLLGTIMQVNSMPRKDVD